MFLLRRLRRKFTVIAGLVVVLMLMVVWSRATQQTHQKHNNNNNNNNNDIGDKIRDEVSFNSSAFSVNKVTFNNLTSSSVFENQLRRQRHLAEACARLGLGRDAPNFKTSDMYVNDSLRYIYCVVNKVACTTWKRVLLMASGQMKVDKPEKLSMTYVHNWKITDEYMMRIRKYSLDEIRKRLKTHFKFTFVRHPLERLVSTYRDKFTKPAYYYKQRFGTRIVRAVRGVNATPEALKRGHDVTFPEMVRYLLDPPQATRHDGRLLSDNHWIPENQLCHPCYVKYDFIGHYETLYEDAQFVLNKLGVSDRVQFPNSDPDNRWKKKTKDVAEQILSEISAEDTKRVRQLYDVDFQLFGYE